MNEVSQIGKLFFLPEGWGGRFGDGERGGSILQRKLSGIQQRLLTAVSILSVEILAVNCEVVVGNLTQSV